MAVEDKDTKETASEIQSSLHDFAAASTKKRETRILNLAEVIKSSVTPEVLAGISGSGDRLFLRHATSLALKTKFDTGVGKPFLPWEGGYTVVMLDRDGSVVSWDHRLVGRVYQQEQYHNNLYPYALTKALIRLHLLLDGRQGGLEVPENQKYMQKLGFVPGVNLFRGESIYPGFSQPFPIGASGCELKMEYIDGLLPSKMEYGYEFLAGQADMEFAELVGALLLTPDMPRVIPEPKFFWDLRNSH